MGGKGSKAKARAKADLSPEKIAEARKLNAKLDSDVHGKMLKDQAVKKLLLLGAGESGKSTLFKQMVSLYGKGFGEEDRKQYKNVIYNNVISAMKTLCKQAEDGKDSEIRLQEDSAASKDVLTELKNDAEINAEIAAHIKKLWKDPAIKYCFENRSKYQVLDSADYFFDRIDEIAKSGYIPSEMDLLKCRARTTGIIQTKFEIGTNVFHVFDVGGQRNERKKWIHCFENVTAVMFVAAISEYDQTLWEDDTTNRIDEALNLFEEVCNSRWFRDTSIILFLNKMDLFIEKLKKSPLKKWYPEYTGKDDSKEDACDFFKELFSRKNKHPDKVIYSHVTTATDRSNVDHVFNAVKDIIIRNSLRDGGLLP